MADVSGDTVRIDAGGAGTFNNEGQLQVTQGTLRLDEKWDNNGTIELTDGTLTLGGSFTLDDLGVVNRAAGTVKLTARMLIAISTASRA